MAEQSVSAPGINYAFPSKIGGTGTGVKVFPDLIIATNGAALPMRASMQGQIFTFNAAGTVHLHGTSPTLIPTLLYSLTTPVLTGATTVSALTTAQLFASTGADYPWALTIKMQGDSTSNIIQVISASWTCNSVTSTTFTNTAITGVAWTGTTSDGNQFAPTLPIFSFGLNIGVSDAANAASMYQYNLEY